MEYSGTTSWGGRVRGQLPGARTDPSFKGTEGSWDLGGAPHRDLWGLKGPLASHSLQVADQMKQFPVGQGRAPSHRVGLSWARRLLLPALTLTFLRRQQMRSMFFKRSRCRGRKRSPWGRRRSGHWAAPTALPTSPADLHVAARGRHCSLSGSEAAAPSPWQPSPWRDLHPRLHGNGPEPGNGRPARRNPSPEPAPGVCWGRGQTGRGTAAGPTTHPFFPSPVPHPPSPATDGKTDGRTHLGTAHVSLTARAGFPWSMGFLKSVRSSSKAMIWGRGVCPSGLGQQFMAPHPSFCGIGIHTWVLDQMALAAKVEKLRLREGRGLAQGHRVVWNGILVC